MIRPDRAKYTHFDADSRWRIWVMDEPGDIVIGIDHLTKPQPEGKWTNVAHFDQTEQMHDFYHAHLPGRPDERIPLGENLSREDKLKVGFAFLQNCAEQGLIMSGSDMFTYADMFPELERQVLAQRAKNGSAQHNIPINSTTCFIG